ncbi:MAG: hypothetical protein ABIP02_10075 [Arenimonas sp.]
MKWIPFHPQGLDLVLKISSNEIFFYWKNQPSKCEKWKPECNEKIKVSGAHHPAINHRVGHSVGRLYQAEPKSPPIAHVRQLGAP